MAAKRPLAEQVIVVTGASSGLGRPIRLVGGTAVAAVAAREPARAR